MHESRLIESPFWEMMLSTMTILKKYPSWLRYKICFWIIDLISWWRTLEWWLLIINLRLQGRNKNRKLIENIYNKILSPEVNVDICYKVYRRFNVIFCVHVELKYVDTLFCILEREEKKHICSCQRVTL